MGCIEARPSIYLGCGVVMPLGVGRKKVAYCVNAEGEVKASKVRHSLCLW